MFITRISLIALIGLFCTLSSSPLAAQQDWETLPVFHNGRVMPLHTFARKIVRDICGTEQPFIVRDERLTADFKPSNRETGGNQTALPIQRPDPAHTEHLLERLRQLVPPEGRPFTADELLFTWIFEPDVWFYIPLFRIPETEYLTEMFGEHARNSPNRVSLHQLTNSPRYAQRLAEIQRRHEQGHVAQGQTARTSILFDQITLRLAGQVQVFQELTFHPQRQIPTRMLDLLYQTVGLTEEPSSYMSALGAWGYILEFGEVPERQTTERATPGEGAFLHSTTQRWHNIGEQMLFLMQIYDRTDQDGTPLFPRAVIVEEQYEMLIDLVDRNLAEAAALMESLYPGVSYRLPEDDRVIDVDRLLPRLNLPENQPYLMTIRRAAISYYYSVKSLRKEIEAAYLALYDNGLSLRLLPLHSPLVLELGSSENTLGVQPWASAPMLFGSGEAFVKRFFDPPGADSGDSELGDRELLEQLLFQPLAMQNGILPLDRGEESSIDAVRISLKGILDFYTAPTGGGYGSSGFTLRVQDLQHALRRAAEQIEPRRQSWVPEENQLMLEHVAKTAYPAASASRLLAEYRYDRLRPFHWMWIFALAALLLSGAAYGTAVVRRKPMLKTILIKSVTQDTATKEWKEQEREQSDYTGTLEEWFLIGSTAMLLLAMLIAFWGGWMRASISGWAPVTNMYETVVMTAALAAMIGVWFALAPLLYPAWRQAWLHTKFPHPGALLERLAARRTEKAFDIPGSTISGGESPVAELSPEEFDTQQRIQVARRKLTGQCLLVLPRLLLTFAAFYAIVLLANGDYAADHGLMAAAINMFDTEDTIDWLTVAACVFLMVWFVPHALLALCLMPVILFHPHWIAADLGIRSMKTGLSAEGAALVSEAPDSAAHPEKGITLQDAEKTGLYELPDTSLPDTSGRAWLTQARNAVLDRKLFIAITASIVFIVGLIAYLNRAEFNPDIRPIAAVLRSNFWLAVHVIAILISYAAAFIAWGMAAVSLGYVIFGRYRRIESASKEQRTLQRTSKGERRQILLPEPCQLFLPVIERLIKIALLLLIVGTVLGARWADYSWGRFWSWDPKEVWALITILFLAVVLHGKIARYYGAVGIFTGALFASIAVIITWYGINYVFTSSDGRHTYGGGTASTAVIFMWGFIAVNLLWGTLALLRYGAEFYSTGNMDT